MAEPFDPYHRWLGIPPKHQPPDHYRMLSLERFEDDEEVIRDAAERQITHVRKYQLGEHAEIARKLLNELARAKACLLGDQQRTEYDVSLRAEEQFVNAQRANALAANAPRSITRSPRPTRHETRIVEPLISATSESAPRLDVVATEPVAIDTSSEFRPSITKPPSRQEQTGRKNRQFSEIRDFYSENRKQFVVGAGLVVGVVFLIAVSWIVLASRGRNDPETLAESAGESESSTSESNAGSAASSDSSKLRTEKDASRVFSGDFADISQNSNKTVKEPVPSAVKLATISNHEIDEGKQLEFDLRTESATGKFRFAFGKRPPRGAKLDAETGRFQWKPNETQGPGTYSFSVRAVVDFGDVLDETDFEVRVREVNSPPRISNPEFDRVDVGKELRIQLEARDADRPRNTFAFYLLDAPSWARVDQRTGELLLAPPTGTSSSWTRISVLVRDSGTPPQTTRETYTFPVLAPPVLKRHGSRIAVGAEDKVRGSPNAPITILLQLEHPDVHDFRLAKQLVCRIYQTVMSVVQTQGLRVNVVFRPYAYDWFLLKKIGPASECVFELRGNSAYWEFLDAVYSTPSSEDVDFVKCAGKAGVSPSVFRDSMLDQKLMEKCLERYHGGRFNTQYSLVFSDTTDDPPFLTAALDTQSFTMVYMSTDDDDRYYWFPLTFLDNRSATAKLGPRTGSGYYYSGEINTDILEKLVDDLYKTPSR